VKCRVPFCELYFTKYNSLYRHTVRHHPELYNGDVVTQNTTVHRTSNEHDEPEISTIDDHSSEDRTLCDGAESNGDATSSDENTSSDSDSSSSDESSYSDTEEDDDNHAHPTILRRIRLVSYLPLSSRYSPLSARYCLTEIEFCVPQTTNVPENLPHQVDIICNYIENFPLHGCEELDFLFLNITCHMLLITCSLPIHFFMHDTKCRAKNFDFPFTIDHFFDF